VERFVSHESCLHRCQFITSNITSDTYVTSYTDKQTVVMFTGQLGRIYDRAEIY